MGAEVLPVGIEGEQAPAIIAARQTYLCANKSDLQVI